MKRPSLAYLSLGAALAVAACGSDQLFSGGGRGTTTGTGASTTTQTGAGGNGTTTTSTTGAMGGGGNVTTTTTSLGGAGGFGGGPAEVPCYSEICSSPHVCCISSFAPELDQCGTPGSCDAIGFEADCNGPSDCPHDWLCCGRWVPNGQSAYYTAVVCSPTCVPDANSQGVTLCDTQDDCTVGTCTPSALLPEGFDYCYVG